MEISELVVTHSRTCPEEAVGDRWEESGTVTECVAFITLQLAAATLGTRGASR